MLLAGGGEALRLFGVLVLVLPGIRIENKRGTDDGRRFFVGGGAYVLSHTHTRARGGGA